MTPTPATPTTRTETTVLWPPERFYWAEIDAMGWRGTGVLPPGLRLIAADELPVSMEDLQAVGVPVEKGRVLVCACPKDALAALEPAVVELKPANLPAGIGSGGVIDQLNLLIGECEPPVRRAKRVRVHTQLGLTVLLCSLLVSVGLLRRAWAASAEAIRAGIAADSRLLEFGTPRNEDGLAAQAKLMRSIADAARKAKPAPDAAAALEALLKTWPTQSLGKPQSVSVGPDGISMGVVVEGDPAPVLMAIKPPKGYVLDEPRLATAGPVTRVSLHLRPAGGGQ